MDMKNFQENNMSGVVKAETHFWKHSFPLMNISCIECAIQLGIPDIVYKHGTVTLSQLTATLPIHTSKALHVYRLMRILVNAGFFIEQTIGDEKCFTLTTAGELLTLDGGRMASRIHPLVSCPPMLKSWTHLSQWYTNDDDTPFETANGTKFWSYFDEDPDLRKVFNEGMAGESEFTSMLLMEKCGFAFEGLESLVDVGGGTGATARDIAYKFPNMKCFVFDLPNVVVNQVGTQNLEFVGGSMFDEIPQANAVLLKFILHNWNDDDCVKILKKCKEAILPSKDKGGKVIIIDVVMVDPDASDDPDVLAVQTCSDMQMLVEFGGRERTEKELALLFQKAGFSTYKVFPVLGYRSLIEAYF